MTMVAVLPVEIDGAPSFRAVAGDRHSLGKTVGEALDALTAQFPGGTPARWSWSSGSMPIDSSTPRPSRGCPN